MKTLSKFICLAFILLLFISCKSTVKTFRGEKISISDSTLFVDVTGRASLLVSSLSQMDGTWQITYYDVTMEKDPQTGMHPVVAIAEGSYSRRDSSFSQQEDTIHQSSSLVTHHQDQDINESHEEKKQETTPQSFFDKFSKLILSISLLVFVLVASFLLLKFACRK